MLLQINQCGGEFYLSACGMSIPTHSGGNDYVPASDGRAARLATDGVDTEKLPALCGGGYVLTRVGEPNDVHLQYVYFSWVYEFRGSRRRTWNLSKVKNNNILQTTQPTLSLYVQLLLLLHWVTASCFLSRTSLLSFWSISHLPPPWSIPCLQTCYAPLLPIHDLLLLVYLSAVHRTVHRIVLVNNQLDDEL